ncbi:peptidase M28 [Hymenobacter roseosalivarius DSM 11622]|uniref:Peptidase M28 n=1 Tax=Hymenobacter roseosalivarius DSM 11622 TaxID=645990 RepID=A0A1W1W4C1_9BACT|nr:M28 family peptidase [Hymenobacter roseosalivarius]SMC00363.1 peptidase M28 [Hymenobacter roseosalivarius DSM 11622]
MRYYVSLLSACLLFSESGLAQSKDISKPVQKALSSVSADNYKAHVRYLADDKLQGRLPGTPGYQLAVEYVVAQLKKAGVEPAGENGGYTQQVRLRRAFTEPAATMQLQNATGQATTLKAGEDFVLYPNPEVLRTTIAAAPLVFAGYGISAPSLGYDDYAGLDAKGKVVVVTREEPKQFAAAVRLYNTDVLTILQTAARHGAVGVLLAFPKPTARLPNFSKGQVSVLGPDGKVSVSRSYAGGQIQVLGAVNAVTFHQLFAGAATDTARAFATLRAGRPASGPLLPRLSATQSSRYLDVISYNVVGRITGSDPQLRNEYVVHSAHLDHLGIGEPVQGDSLYNGAHDNATGVASLLGIASAYQHLKQKPRRSVLIVAVTGEEMGLLGSAYFAQNPTVPKAQLVANINTDMPTIIAPLLSVVALGAENSSLAGPVAEASQALGLTVEADPEPAQNRFIRSDQYSFVAQGIPALHIKYGDKTADGRNNHSEQVQAWRANYYHKPQDDINGVFDFEAGKKYVQLNFLIGYLVANDAQRPTWNPGNFFGQKK